MKLGQGQITTATHSGRVWPFDQKKAQGRWTFSEHRKFVEGIKLYARKWIRIEEHVGSRTAGQVRSHAQKYFGYIARMFNYEPTEQEIYAKMDQIE